MADPGWLIWIEKWLGRASLVDWIVRIFFGFASMAWAVSVMPGGWHPPQYWAAAGATFSGSLLIASLGSMAVKRTWKAFHPVRYRREVHGGRDAATVTLFVESGVEKFRPTGQLLDDSGRPILPPYDIQWRSWLRTDRTKTISAGEHEVLILATAHETGGSMLIDLVGSGEHVNLRRHPNYSSRYVDLVEPVRLRLTIRGDTGLCIEHEYLVTYSGEHRLFTIEEAN